MKRRREKNDPDGDYQISGCIRCGCTYDHERNAAVYPNSDDTHMKSHGHDYETF